MINGLHTCAIFTTLDCYWEGSIIQNPPDTVIVESPSYCQPEMPQYLNWSNFDYAQFIECLETHEDESMYNEQVISVCVYVGCYLGAFYLYVCMYVCVYVCMYVCRGGFRGVSEVSRNWSNVFK